MKQTRARLGSLLLVVAMLLTLLPVSAFAADESVAKIGDTEYTTLAAAFEAVGNEAVTVTLLKDTVVSTSITIDKGETVTFDMQGHTITVDEGFSTRVFTNNGNLTIQGNGTIDVTAAGANGYGTVNNFGTLTVVDGTYTNPKESDASNFYNRSGGTATFGTPTVSGGGGCIATQVNTTTTINGGIYSDETYPAIENRGNMLITGGTFINTSCSSCDGRWGYTVRSGESAENAYLKIQGETEDSVKVTGVQGGLAVIGGTADIYNGDYKTEACDVHTNGASAFYAGYFTGESYKTATTIYGGSFQSCSKTAVLVGNGNPAPDSGAGKESTVMIKGGTFVGGDAAHTAITVNKTEYAVGAANITGGTFSSDVSAYVDLSSNVTEGADGNFVIIPNEKEDGVAEIDGKYYKTLGDAIASVGDGETIQVLKDIPNAEGISVPSGKNFTIDFGGYTYTLTGPGAGSPNTESNGFQFLKDSAITMKNGTIRIAEDVNNIKRIIQNYADLTLENMQFYAENQVGGEDYALSFNNGNVTFKGNTSVFTTSDDTVAFDVYYWAAYYPDGIGVTFAPDYTGTVNGVIMYDSTDATKASLTIQGNGTFGGVVASSGSTNTPNIAISGGTFPAGQGYIVPGMEQNETGKIVIDTDTAVAEINGVGYTSLDAALAAAKEGDTVKLLKDLVLDQGFYIVNKPGITIDGNGHSINASATFTNNSYGQHNLMKIDGSNGVTVKNLTLITNEKAKHALDIYGSDNVVLENVKLDHSAAEGGAALVINQSKVTAKGNFDVVVGNSSWYGINIDDAGVKNSASLTFDSSVNFTFTDKSKDQNKEIIFVEPNTEPNTAVIHPENAGLVSNGDGTFDPAPVSGSTTYAITVEKADNGTVTTSRTRASKGLTITLTVKADEGYELDTLTVTDKNGNEVKLTDKGDGKYTFTMPGSRVTVEATFAKEGSQTDDLPFTDVAEGDWYYDAVQYVYENDLMNGTSATVFSPFMTTSRAMILTILARYDGVDTSTGSTWYEAGAAWAVAEGVSDGTNLEANLTREQLVTMLWRYAGSPVVEGDLSDYPDSASVSDWAVNAMIWAVENGVITGTGTGALNPQGTATRAEVATILMRFIQK